MASTAIALTKQAPQLKERVINEKVIFQSNAIPMNNTTREKLFISHIDSSGTGDYFIIDTLARHPGVLILVIARKYPEENTAWIVSYDHEKLSGAKKVYYDNAEGFLQVETIIKDNRIHISTQNDYDEENGPVKEVFIIDEYLQFIKI